MLNIESFDKNTHRYAMYTPSGDRAIHNRLNTIKKKINKALETNSLNRSKLDHIITVGINGYRSMNNEASDTAVREVFFCEVEYIIKETDYKAISREITEYNWYK